ncbi:copper resistance protein CopC [Plantactinospora solaniradicis]|uniref:Copper resistance protein CopC n=1 Tax=Plantactinospora solaniradicis TaxID=1723736 RepID=A0ABW1KMD8_9ACTN
MEEIMGGRVTRLGALLLSVVSGVLWVLLPASPAAAHNSLTGSDPRNGARLGKAPDNVRLTFLARLDPTTTRITVTGPDNISATAGKPSYSGSRVTIPFRPAAAGLYIVQYQVASGDGHPIKGEVRFTLTVGVTPTATPSPATTATGASTTVPSSPAGAPSSPAAAGPLSPTADADGSAWWPWVVGGALVLAALAGGLLLRRRATGSRSAD